jgi:hypothetical protein
VQTAGDGEPRLATVISTPDTMFAAPVGLLAHETKKAEGWGLDESTLTGE